MGDKTTPKPKPTITVGTSVTTNVQVIFVAKYASPAKVVTEVSTAIFRTHADKQQKAALTLTPPIKTYVFEVTSLGDIKTSIVKGIKADETIERIDVIAHGNEDFIGLSGQVTADNVIFDDPAVTVFDQAQGFRPMAKWENRGFAIKGKYVNDALAWQTAVGAKLTKEAIVNVYACNSGGLDTSTGAVDDEGVLLSSIAQLFDRAAVGFAGFLLWTLKPAIATNIYAVTIGVPPTLLEGTEGREPQAAKDLSFYRDLNTVQRRSFPALHLVITRAP